ncbi:MAG TPA: hypothetical protein ENN87_15140 [Phycisphaerales bacterium]|nr:hypothetical protein [Phycisphaerales bacterium]
MSRIFCILIALALAVLVQTCCADGGAWAIPSATPPEPGRIMEPESHSEVLVLAGLLVVMALPFLVPGAGRVVIRRLGGLVRAVRRVAGAQGTPSEPAETEGEACDADANWTSRYPA